ncbi:hypothetical protein BGZ96_007104 [Linnemannia gamsii]|uniref:Uncharacterized protein n=1 Tax=Linnemannia gamsii TaxID=64522 RepID=A0ABQ7K1V3_9FUNG|nr:hypothetical protein BGZ96_007104 [Linnemannia gamsii]
MAMAKKLATCTTSPPIPSPVLGSDAKGSSTLTTSLLKRKPVKTAKSSGSPASIHALSQSGIKASANLTPPPKDASISNMVGPPHSQNQQQQQQQYAQNRPSQLQPTVSRARDMMAICADDQSSNATPVSFKQSQEELFSKLDQLAAARGKTKPGETQGGSVRATPSTTGTRGNGNGGSSSYTTLSCGNKQYGTVPNKSITFNQSQGHNHSGLFLKQGSTSNASLKLQPRKTPGGGGGGGGAGGTQTVNKPRRRINSAQFRTPSAVEMAELAQVVMANASPPKVQNKLRKRASTLSLTATTFMPSGSQNPSVTWMGSHGGAVRPDQHNGKQDYRQLYEAVLKEAKVWEKKYSSAQNQIHYERERWEEKYGELERMYRDLESSRTEANVDKMNSLLDTVQQLQLANEVFRKQLQDADIEPDPMPAAQFHSRHLLVGENLDRTFLEENELMKNKSLITNQKISHLSTEINNVAIAISQTINYVQLRYLTQMLDAAEHVSSQRRTRAMSNSFLSDMLSRGVKKTGPTQAKNTNSISTQTPAMLLSTLQQQSINNGSASFRPLDSTLSKSFSFTSSLLNLAGLNSNNGQGSTEIIYRLKGGVTDDRSQLTRQGIPRLVIQDLKGNPVSPDTADVVAANRGNPPLPKFQYASPTSSQLRIFVPDSNNLSAFGHGSNMSITSGSRAGSVLDGFEGNDGGIGIGGGGQFRRSSSDISLQVAGLQNNLAQQAQQNNNPQGPVRTGGKYPYPYHHPAASSSSSSSTSNISSRAASQRALSFTAPNNLLQASSQQFLSPEMAILYSHHSKSSTHSISSSTHSSSSSSSSSSDSSSSSNSNGNNTTSINAPSTTTATTTSSNSASDPSGE